MNEPEPQAPLDDAPACPVGEAACGWLEAITALREEVATLREQSHIDPLTGLFNYRHFAETMEAELERASRTDRPVALIMLDLDHFKRINDRHGHEAGNEVLRETARRIRATLRKVDTPCRYGGEEFAIILPGTSLLDVITVAERLREAVALEPVMAAGRAIPVSASLGVNLSRTRIQERAADFVAVADSFLYQAKRSGRNRTCHPTAEELAHSATAVSNEERDALLD